MNMHQHAFLTAEGIELKQTLLEQDIENIKHLDFLGSFAPIYVGLPAMLRPPTLDCAPICRIFYCRRKAMLLQTKLGC
jgi:hypothetical protein